MGPVLLHRLCSLMPSCPNLCMPGGHTLRQIGIQQLLKLMWHLEAARHTVLGIDILQHHF